MTDTTSNGTGTATAGAGDTSPTGATYREDVATDVDDALIEAVGKASEGFEYLERCRGHLYSFHQLMGRADILFGEAAELFADAGAEDTADLLDGEVVGRNVLDGRWTFQIVEEFDAVYYDAVREVMRGLEARYQDGLRHVYEARMKEQRRTRGRRHHEHRPLATHDDRIETDRR